MAKHHHKEEHLPPPQPRWRQMLHNIFETQIARYPLLVQLRAIWKQLQDEREFWPYLIPLLILVFLGTYRGERKRVLAQIATHNRKG
nr:hypothetical protein [Oscillochloris trichoides]